MKKAVSRVKPRKGFTLVEIIIVLLLIAILLIVSYISAPSILARARDAKRKSDIKRVSQAIEEFPQDGECYPLAVPSCGNEFANGDFVLLSNIPCDPLTDNSYVYVPETDSCPSWFQLYGNLETEDDPIITKIGCSGGCGPVCQFNYGVASTNQKLNPYCGPAPSPPPPPVMHACTPSQVCGIFEDPVISGCPNIYPNDPTCLDQCGNKENRCHDSRGRLVPD